MKKNKYKRNKKKKDKRDKKNEERISDIDNEDRISTLDIDILLKILSFLPSEDTAKTSILSKEWKDIWREVDVLDTKPIYDDNLLDEDTLVDFTDTITESRMVRKARLCCYVEYSEGNQSQISEWLSNLCGNRLEELVVILGLTRREEEREVEKWYITPPASLFLCPNLTKLTLEGDISDVPLEGSCTLLAVKSLTLQSINFKSTHGWIKACPRLQYLFISFRGVSFVPGVLDYDLRLETSSLENFELEDPGTLLDSITLDTPNLVSVSISQPCFSEYLTSNLPNLPRIQKVSLDTTDCYPSFRKFLTSIANSVTSMVLSNPTTEFLFEEDNLEKHLPEFQTLECLEVRVSKIKYRCFLDLLGKFPKVNHLIIDDHQNEDADLLCCATLLKTPICVQSHLNKIVFKRHCILEGYWRTLHKLSGHYKQFLRHLIQKGACLKNITFDFKDRTSAPPDQKTTSGPLYKEVKAFIKEFKDCKCQFGYVP